GTRTPRRAPCPAGTSAASEAGPSVGRVYRRGRDVHGGGGDKTKPPPIPDGYGTVTPWVVTKDTRRLLEFIKQAFDAEELARVEVEGGAIGHAEARIGDSSKLR